MFSKTLSLMCFGDSGTGNGECVVTVSGDLCASLNICMRTIFGVSW